MLLERGVHLVGTDEKTGIQALIAHSEVATGQVISPTVGDTRTDPGAGWGFVVDQLNTHKSAALVRLVAERCGVPDDLGRKGESGILCDMASRKAFLEDEAHRVRFVYTPKHCSWLNQVETWFSILAFINVFKETLAKPFRWTYVGKPLIA